MVDGQHSVRGGARPGAGRRAIRGTYRLSARLTRRAEAALAAYCRRHRVSPSQAVNDLLEQQAQPVQAVVAGRRRTFA